MGRNVEEGREMKSFLLNMRECRRKTPFSGHQTFYGRLQHGSDRVAAVVFCDPGGLFVFKKRCLRAIFKMGKILGGFWMVSADKNLKVITRRRYRGNPT